MHTARARALQLAVTAPAVCRRRLLATTPVRASTAAALWTVRGFRSSAHRLALPDEAAGAVHTTDEAATEAPLTAPNSNSEPGPVADAPTVTADTATTAAAPATTATTTTTPTTPYTGGRTRAIRSRSSDGIPAFTLPEWFRRHHVRSFDNHNNNNNTPKNTWLSTSLDQDIAAASLLLYPRGTLGFSTAPPTTRPLLPIPYESSNALAGLEVEGSDRLQMQDYFTAVLDGSGWTDQKVQRTVEQLRRGSGTVSERELGREIDAIVRRGAAVAAAAVYLTTAIAFRGPYPVKERAKAEGKEKKGDDDTLFVLDEPSADGEAGPSSSVALGETETAVSSESVSAEGPAEAPAEAPVEAETATADKAEDATVQEDATTQGVQEEPKTEEPPAASTPASGETETAVSESPSDAAAQADATVHDPTASEEDKEDRETKAAAFNADLLRRLDPHGTLDLPRTPFGGVLVEFVRLTMPTASAAFLAAEADMAAAWGVPIRTQFAERAMFREVQAALAAAAAVTSNTSKAPPARRDWRRPVSVLTVLNYRGQAAAAGVLDEVALTLGARVVHVDAATLAALAGPYLGQTPLLARGSAAMLGYTAARLNGRLLPRYPRLPSSSPSSSSATDDGDVTVLSEAEENGDEDANEFVYSLDGSSSSGDFSISLSRVSSDLLSQTRAVLRSDAEERWDELKMNHVLDAIVRAADGPTSSPQPPLIIHVHNFVELSLTVDGSQILHRLRTIVDRLWQRERRRVVLVGSTSTSTKAETGLVDRAEELRHDGDCHILPYQLPLNHHQYRRQAAAAEEAEVVHENMHNICAMVAALTGAGIAARDLPWVDDLARGGHKNSASSLAKLVYPLRHAVHDVHWVYRIAALWTSVVKGSLGAWMPSSIPADASAEAEDDDDDARLVDLLNKSVPSPTKLSTTMTTTTSELAQAAGQTQSFFTTPSAFSEALAAATTTTTTTTASPPPYTKQSFIHTLWALDYLDRVWCEQGGAVGPYSSPLLIKRYRKARKDKALPWWWTKTLESKEEASKELDGDDVDVDVDVDVDADAGVIPSRDTTDKKAAAAAAAAAAAQKNKAADKDTAATATTKPKKKPNYDAHNFNRHEKLLVEHIVDPADLTTTFDSIVLPAATKDSIKALTSLSLLRPEAFRYGVLATEHIPGCLLYGPPGTGKTLLAKAVAKQSGAKMLEISAASINDMWVGETEKNVRAVFSVARALAPIVVFIDEADALLAARSEHPGRNGQREMMNQFLREWDGLSSSSGAGKKVFIMVATNRPGDLDEAVLRRLPRRILVDLPLRDARLAILRVLLRDEQLDPASVSLDKLADDTDLYSGSDLKNLCVAAAMQAVRDEVAAMDAHTGPAPYAFPPKRVLTGSHFARAMQEIGASISEDMASLQAIRRFDERYGDHGSKKRKRRRGMGFEVVPKPHGTKEAMVRQA